MLCTICERRTTQAPRVLICTTCRRAVFRFRRLPAKDLDVAARSYLVTVRRVLVARHGLSRALEMLSTKSESA